MCHSICLTLECPLWPHLYLKPLTYGFVINFNILKHVRCFLLYTSLFFIILDIPDSGTRVVHRKFRSFFVVSLCLRFYRVVVLFTILYFGSLFCTVPSNPWVVLIYDDSLFLNGNLNHHTSSDHWNNYWSPNHP